MKKISRIALSVAIVGIGFTGLSNSGTALAADSTCNSIVITNTGPGSNNQGTCKVNVSVTAVCNNHVYVLDSNAQAAVTGAAQSLGNTTGGAAISGAATNSNNQQVALGASCDPIAAPAASTPDGGGKGGAGGATNTPAVLPNTSTLPTGAIVASSLALIAGAVVLSRIAVATYRRYILR